MPMARQAVGRQNSAINDKNVFQMKNVSYIISAVLRNRSDKPISELTIYMVLNPGLDSWSSCQHIPVHYNMKNGHISVYITLQMRVHDNSLFSVHHRRTHHPNL